MLVEHIRLAAVFESQLLRDLEVVHRDDHPMVTLLIEFRVITRVESNARVRICFEEQVRVCDIVHMCLKNQMVTEWCGKDAVGRNNIISDQLTSHDLLTKSFALSHQASLDTFSRRITKELVEDLTSSRVPTDAEWYVGLRKMQRAGTHQGMVARDKQVTREGKERNDMELTWSDERDGIEREWQSGLEKKLTKVPRVAHKYALKGMERIVMLETKTREQLYFSMGCDLRCLRMICDVDGAELAEKQRRKKIVMVQSLVRTWAARRRYVVILKESLSRKKIAANGLDGCSAMMILCQEDARSTLYMRRLEAMWCAGIMFGPVPSPYLERQRERCLYCFRMEQEGREQILREREVCGLYMTYFKKMPYLVELEAEESLQRCMLIQWAEVEAYHVIVHESAGLHREKMYGGLDRRELWESEGRERDDIQYEEGSVRSHLLGDSERFVLNFEQPAIKKVTTPLPLVVAVAAPTARNACIAGLEHTESLLRVGRVEAEESVARRIDLAEIILEYETNVKVLLGENLKSRVGVVEEEGWMRCKTVDREEADREDAWIEHRELLLGIRMYPSRNVY